MKITEVVTLEKKLKSTTFKTSQHSIDPKTGYKSTHRTRKTTIPGTYPSVKIPSKSGSSITVPGDEKVFKTQYTTKQTDKGTGSLTKTDSPVSGKTKRFVAPGGSGYETHTSKDGKVTKKKVQLKGPQSWAHDNPK